LIDLYIDLLGENASTLSALRSHFLGKLTQHQNTVQIDYYAVALSSARHWLNHAPSLAHQNRIIFLICPAEHATADEAANQIWRAVVDESETLRRTLSKHSNHQQSLQIIRGSLSKGEEKSDPQEQSQLNLNASYAFANAMNSIGKKNKERENNAPKNYRPLPKTLINYACEKCSDPQCEHKLFSSLNLN